MQYWYTLWNIMHRDVLMHHSIVLSLVSYLLEIFRLSMTPHWKCTANLSYQIRFRSVIWWKAACDARIIIFSFAYYLNVFIKFALLRHDLLMWCPTVDIKYFIYISHLVVMMFYIWQPLAYVRMYKVWSTRYETHLPPILHSGMKYN